MSPCDPSSEEAFQAELALAAQRVERAKRRDRTVGLAFLVFGVAVLGSVAIALQPRLLGEDPRPAPSVGHDPVLSDIAVELDALRGRVREHQARQRTAEATSSASTEAPPSPARAMGRSARSRMRPRCPERRLSLDGDEHDPLGPLTAMRSADCP